MNLYKIILVATLILLAQTSIIPSYATEKDEPVNASDLIKDDLFHGENIHYPNYKNNSPSSYAVKDIDQFKPPVYFWIALVGAILTLLWNVFVFVHNHVKQKNEKNSEISDGFWVRSIIIPTCVNPLIEFVENHAKKLRLIVKLDKETTSDYDSKLIAYLNSFKDDKELVLKRFYALNVKWNNVYELLSQELDQLDDDITMHCFVNQKSTSSSENQVEKYTINEGAFYTALGNILNKLGDIHIAEQ